MPCNSARHAILSALSILALAACGGGGSGGGNNGGGGGGGPTVTVSGTLSYEFVPPNASCGLDMNNPVLRPIREATVVLLNSANAELARTVSSPIGNYSFANVPANTMVRLRVLAESKRGGAPAWDVEVRDNYDASAAPPALGVRPLYSTQGNLFDSGGGNQVRNLTAQTGWSAASGSYTGARAAAPFAILDAIYAGMQFIFDVEPTAILPPLDAFWSVNNTADTDDFDIDNGLLGGSFYTRGIDALFIVGDAGDDTDEFDDHVVAHEWGHYLDDVRLRSDSPGGTHFLGDRLDSRLAFSEGWPTALAAMALGDPLYCDSAAPGTGAGFGINAEGGFFGGQGWYDEVSVVRFFYDIWDTTNEGTDTGSIGFQAIHDAFTGGAATTPAWLNLHSYATELRALTDPIGDALIDSQLGDEQTVAGLLLDAWGENETNPAGAVDVFPLYIDMAGDGTTTNICSNSQFDTNAMKDGNKLSEFRYIRLNISIADQYNVVITSTTPTPPTPDPNDRDQSDPDMYIYFNGTQIADLTSPVENSETGTTPLLQAGTYVADLRDWRYADPERPASYPPVVCFDVRFDPTP